MKEIRLSIPSLGREKIRKPVIRISPPRNPVNLNVSFDGEFYRVYDYKGQLLAVDNTSDSFPSPEGLYAYDCHNRRVRKSGTVKDNIFAPFCDAPGGTCTADLELPVSVIGLDNNVSGLVDSYLDSIFTPDASLTDGSEPLSPQLNMPAYSQTYGGAGEDTPVFQAGATNLGGEIPSPLPNSLLLTDGASTVSAVVYADTALVGSEVGGFTCGAFGDNATVSGSTLNPYFYKRYHYDTETGDYYCWNRYYNPETGSWMQIDPVASTHPDYGYPTNPVLISDYTGLITKEEGIGDFNQFKTAYGDPACQECCCPADVSSCQRSAKYIGNILRRAWSHYFGKGPIKDHEDGVGGYHCWDWQEIFTHRLNRATYLKNKYWTWEKHKAKSTSDEHSKHFFIHFYACNNRKSECTIVADDGIRGKTVWRKEAFDDELSDMGYERESFEKAPSHKYNWP
ncbi:MAG: RHS repeat-associated core domain-containing protein [Planctomycetota bacterium]|jgi:RHS repeat-associated protein